MRIRHLLFATTLILVTATITSTVVSQDKGKAAGKDQPPAMSAEQIEMMQKAKVLGAPGENHKLIAAKVGTWTAAGKMWMDPGADPFPFGGKTECKSMWDGRYVIDTTDGDPQPGEPAFHGLGTNGYDNIKKKFIWSWIDNEGTGIMYAEGTYDAATKSFKYAFEMPDMRTGKYVAGRSVEKWIDADHFTMEWYGPDKTGKEYKIMELNYSRNK